tara:strand:- start:10413 stop:11294 length:882 start_codon:yes stop_codon:yes gene_type:complete
MRLIHYTPSNYESGSFGGVARFDYELRKAFPSITSVLRQRDIPWYSLDINDTIVITDHSFIHEIPQPLKVIAVHHGMAAEHKKRNPAWDGDIYVRQQAGMSTRPKTWFVGISEFTKRAAKEHHGITDSAVILHGVDTKCDHEIKKGTSVVGDWRTESKGAKIIDEIKATCTKFQFHPLSCGQYNKVQGYKSHNIYMCVSYHEGNAYAVMDAIACGLPVLSTTSGLFDGDYDERLGEVIPWKERGNANLINEKLQKIYDNYDKYDPTGWMRDIIPFDKWKKQWQEFVTKIGNNK